MRKAKSGQWWLENGQRALANNSGCYSRTPDMGLFMSEWKALYDSKSGERGILTGKLQRTKHQRMRDVIQSLSLVLILAAK